MLGLRLRLRVQDGAALHTATRLTVHKLASLDSVTMLPHKKMQSVLYPLSELELLLDRYAPPGQVRSSWTGTLLLDRSVDRGRFQLFQPSVEDMAEAEKLFCSSPGHKISYYSSAERMDHVPALQQPEVCFLGRSNVGKSSLIRALMSLSPEVDVRVSKTPGHTRKMNFFRVGRAFTITDMPGYGHRAPRDFLDMVEPYLNTRTNLARTFLLVDGSVGLQTSDMAALKMCEESRRPYVVVMTKTDKCGVGVLLTNLLNVQHVLKTQTSRCLPQPFLISSLRFSGIHLLRCFIAYVTGGVRLSR